MLSSRLTKFRRFYEFRNPESLNWYPGHMRWGLVKMQAKLRNIDAIVEVHDARIPFSGRNPQFTSMLAGARPHMLVLNKVDLIDSKYQSAIRKKYKSNEPNLTVCFTNCKDQRDPGLNKVIKELCELIDNSNRYHRANEQQFQCMVVGVPNVGKSSIINALRNLHTKRGGRATKIGAAPGITRGVLELIHISHRPAVYVRDTPGVVVPQVRSPETGMRLTLCAVLPDHNIGFVNVADYLLYWLNVNYNYTYVEHMNVTEPTDNIDELLAQSAINNGRFLRVKDISGRNIRRRPDINWAAQRLLDGFRINKYGKIVLDNDLLETEQKC